jgi:hypothetical protein
VCGGPSRGTDLMTWSLRSLLDALPFCRKPTHREPTGN